jgi:poly(3-hydroxybutyrate) depolymerase
MRICYCLSLLMPLVLTDCQRAERLVYRGAETPEPMQSEVTITSKSVTAYSLIFAPRDPDRGRLLVVLHGCSQTAETMAAGTQFNRLAEREHLVVLYPQAPPDSPQQCWSWFKPENQLRGSGQLQLIMDEIEATKINFAMQSPRVYVVGISACSYGGWIALSSCKPGQRAGRGA